MRSIITTHRAWKHTLVVLSVMVMATPEIRPQSESKAGSWLIFPRFSAYQYQSSGIAIFNPGDTEARVELAVKQWNGGLVSTAANPKAVIIPPRGQIAKTAGELFGAQVFFDASLEIKSETPGLVTYYQAFDSSLTFMDGAEAAKASTSLVFPVIPGSGEGASEISFRNPNPKSTAVELKLWSFTGRLLGRTVIQVPANGIYRNYPELMFPDQAALADASHMTAVSKPVNLFSQAQSVMGTSLFLGFSSTAAPSGFYDIAALNALPATETPAAGAFPHFRTGGAHASTLSIANVETAAIEVTVTAVSKDGAALGTRTLNLNASGGVRARLEEIITSLGSEAHEGWLLIQATGRVAAALIYGPANGAALAALPMQPAPKMELAFPHFAQIDGIFTEIALANPTSETSYVDLYVITPGGQTAARASVTVGSMELTRFRLNEMVPEIGKQAGGVIYITASEPIFAQASIGSERGDWLSGIAPQSLDTAFYPAALEKFAVTGRVLLNDLPAEGFVVVLSGPSGGLAQTDKNGIYAFAGLQPGKYSVTVDQPGFEFMPAQANLEITTASQRLDFYGYTAADGILVQPSAIRARSKDVTVFIYGKDFNGTSEAYIGPVRLHTTFIEPTQLTAIVPSFLLESPSRLNLYVATNPDSDDLRLSQPCPIFVYADRPVLREVLTGEDIPEGTPGATIVLHGSGFLQGATVKVNGKSDGIQAIVTDEETMLAYLPPKYLAQGGIYPVTVQNPYPANTESNIQLLTVYFPAPAVQGILPAMALARLESGSPPLEIEVRGSGFRLGALVLFNRKPLVTNYCDGECQSTRLYAIVPPDMLRESGFAEIAVQNPVPSMGCTQTAYLRIEGLQPTINSVLPGAPTALDLPFKYSMPIVIRGTNFGPQTQVRVYKAGASPLPKFVDGVEWVSSTQLTYFLNIEYQTSLGEWNVEVANPSPGGGQSEAVSFLIAEGSFVANPFLISLSPQTVAAGYPAFTLTISGTNLKPGAIVYFDSRPLAANVVNSRQIKVEVPSSLIQSPGHFEIYVSNPDNGGTSNRLYMDIR